jgi:segregation and condensation protein A
VAREEAETPSEPVVEAAAAEEIVPAVEVASEQAEPEPEAEPVEEIVTEGPEDFAEEAALEPAAEAEEQEKGVEPETQIAPEPGSEEPAAETVPEAAVESSTEEVAEPVEEADAEEENTLEPAAEPEVQKEEAAEPAIEVAPEPAAEIADAATQPEEVAVEEVRAEKAEEAQAIEETAEDGSRTDNSPETHPAGAEAPINYEAGIGTDKSVPFQNSDSDKNLSAAVEDAETQPATANDQPAAEIEIASELLPEPSQEEVAEAKTEVTVTEPLAPLEETAEEAEETQAVEETPEESSDIDNSSETHPAGAEAPINYEAGIGTDKSVPFQNSDSDESLSAAVEAAETQSGATDDQPVTVETDAQEETSGEPAAAATKPESAEAAKDEEAKEQQPAKHFIKLEPREGDVNASPFSVIVSEVYDGPLDLLLDLIRKQDIDIYDIPIARITAQFLAYVDQLKATDVDVAGEFIYTAALLIHIKSKMLLPRAPAGPTEEAEDPRRELVERLLEHERFKNAAQMLQQKQLLEAATWTNPGMREFRNEEGMEPEIAADTVDLVRVFRDILERARNRPTINVEEDSVTVAQMIQFLTRRLTMEDKPIALRRLLGTNRTEHALIAMFLALLELVRLQAILLRQDAAFSDIFIKKNTGFEAVMNAGLTNAQDDWR